MTNSLEPFKELYDTLTRIRDLPERSETLITQALELVLELEEKYKSAEDEISELQDETNNLTRYIGKADQEHIATRNELDEANTDLVRAYAQIGKAYMRAVEDD